jgi:hypothetical protein
MATHQDLWIASRARQQLLEQEIAAMRRQGALRQARDSQIAAMRRQGLSRQGRDSLLAAIRHNALPSGARRSLLAANALQRMSELLLRASKYLACYADRMLASSRPQALDKGLGNPC